MEMFNSKLSGVLFKECVNLLAAVQKYKEWDIQKCNTACCCVWEWNVATHVEGSS